MWGPKAGDPPRPSFPEGLLDELGLRGRVYPPEGTFAGLLLGPRHLDEVAVQRQVVADRVLQERWFGLVSLLLVWSYLGLQTTLFQSGTGPNRQDSIKTTITTTFFF